MKLAEFEFVRSRPHPMCEYSNVDSVAKANLVDAVFDLLDVGSPQTMALLKKGVRVEIHSVDDPPWPTERPDGWGVGWWCEAQRLPEKSFRGICVVDDSDGWATVVVPEEASVWELPVDQITAYGPRAEV